ncbi:hypothetical protein AAF712_016519 [Marasmius tenuissimus]|uniref:PH domain-containing protein n=1 Tax=Marasmius tenuissimus TaxID=585030 RepID=A0ABR2Z7N4_9AGAR
MDFTSHIAAKPFMSQPMLSLHHQPNPQAHQNVRNADLRNPRSGRESFSSQSEGSSADSSPIRTETTLPRSSQKHAIAVGVGMVHGATTAVSVAVGSHHGLGKGATDGLPQSQTSLSSTKQPYPGLPPSSHMNGSSRSSRLAESGTRAISRNGDRDERARTADDKRVGGVSTSSTDQLKIKGQSTPQVNSSSVSSSRKGKEAENVASSPSLSSAKVLGTSEIPSTSTFPPSPTTPASRATTRPSVSISTISTSTASSSATVTPRNNQNPKAQHEIPPVPSMPRPSAMSVPTPSSSSVTGFSKSSSSDAAAFASSIPRSESPSEMESTSQQTQHTPAGASKRRSLMTPKLTFPLPGHKRFSLTDGDSARLSPSIIIRQPAWPILHLPPSTPSTSGRPQTSPGVTDASSNIAGAVRPPGRRPSSSSTTGPKLRHMPALTMDGAGEPEEPDEEDIAEESESSEEEGGNTSSDEDEDDDGYQSARTSTSQQEKGNTRTNPISVPPPPMPPSREGAATPKANPSRTPRFGQLGNVAHDYFSGVFSPSTPSTVSTKTPKPQASFYVTPASTPSVPPSATPGTNPPTLPPLMASIPMSFPPFNLSPSTPVARTPFNGHKRASRSMFDLSASLAETDGDGILDHCVGISRKPSLIKPAEQIKARAREQRESNKEKESADRPTDVDATPVPPSSLASTSVAPIPIPIHTPKPIVLHTPMEEMKTLDSLIPGATSGTARSASLKRRRSMPLFTPSSPPPPYPTFFHHPPQSLAGAIPPPGTETHADPPPPPPPLHEIPEGREELPGYSNAIYIRAVMPRKMEFTKPSVPARDRKWRRVICELEGTAFRVYEFKQKGVGGAGKVKEWWERKVGVGDVSGGVGIGGGMGGNVGSAGVSVVPDGNGAARIGNATNSDDMTEEERARRRRMQKIDVTDGTHEEGSPKPQATMEVRIPASPPTQPSTRGRVGEPDQEGSKPKPPSRSRFTFLKPGKSGKSHSRSNSEAPTREGSLLGSDTPPTRSSLNLPRPSVNSSRSGGSDEIMEEPRVRPRNSRQSLSTASPRQSLSTRSSHSMMRPSVVTSQSDPTNTSTTSGATPISQLTAASSSSFLGSQTTQECPLPDRDCLMKTYTLQNAESGLGNDYIKRKNVIRVRMDGEQFLLQAKDVASVIEWIEGLHSAANIALDLDERPMPRGPLFPRRRRRRQRRNTGEGNGNGDGGNGGNLNGGSTNTGALDPRS